MGIFDFIKKNKNIINNNGLNELYYDKGKGPIEEIFNKKGGKIDGVRKSFYRSGRLRNITEYKDGLKHGIFKTVNDFDEEYPVIERKYVMGEMVKEKNHYLDAKKRREKERKWVNHTSEDAPLLTPKNNNPKDSLSKEKNDTSKEKYLSTLTEVQLADIKVINSRSKYDYESKTIHGKTLDEVALSHYETYKENEDRVPKEDRKQVSEYRVESFLNIREFIEKFGSCEQKFSFDATIIASLMLSSNYINFSDSKSPLKFFLKYNSLIRGGIPYHYKIKSALLKELFDRIKLKANDNK